jgi:hypothetical protein
MALSSALEALLAVDVLSIELDAVEYTECLLHAEEQKSHM